MGPIWGRQDPGGPNVDPMNFAIWVFLVMHGNYYMLCGVFMYENKPFNNNSHDEICKTLDYWINAHIITTFTGSALMHFPIVMQCYVSHLIGLWCGLAPSPHEAIS